MLGKLFSGGAAELVKGVGGVIDNLHTSGEEKLEAERKIKELVANYEVEMEKTITERWKVDMNSDSWLSKNIRPMVLIFLVVATGKIGFTVVEKYFPIIFIFLLFLVIYHRNKHRSQLLILIEVNQPMMILLQNLMHLRL